MSNLQPLVSIIILNYNAGKLLEDCVESVLNSNYKNIEIIVVDNVSSDDSHKLCKEKFPKINLIENSKNFGYCEGNNIGVKNSQGSFIIILNPDTLVEPNWINELISAFKTFGEGLYQPKILSLYEKNILQSTGNMINLFGFGFALDKGLVDKNKITQSRDIGYASGTCLFTKKSTFEKIGFFDPFIFLYHDDLDLGWRARQIGIKSYYVPNSIIYHAESYSLKWSEKKFFWLERNRKFCLLTHYSKSTYKKMWLSLLIVDILVWIFYISKGFIRAKINAEIHLLKNKDLIKKRYQEIEEKKIIPDNKLIQEFSEIIFVPGKVNQGISNKIFNYILKKLSCNVKNKIC